MAKLFKISAYIIDANDEFCTDGDGIADCITYCTQNDFNLDHLKIQSADLGEWYDEHPLNYIDCPEAEFEKYFKEN
jgi:hypothetical protein